MTPLSSNSTMAKNLLLAFALLLLGALVGNEAARYANTRHQPARAVMQLLQFHFNRLSAAGHSGQCKVFLEERERMFAVYGDIPAAAFPLAYAQDAAFRQHAQSLRDALQPYPGDGGECDDAASKRIDDACEACHRDYR
jgi:hypothetical protein